MNFQDQQIITTTGTNHWDFAVNTTTFNFKIKAESGQKRHPTQPWRSWLHELITAHTAGCQSHKERAKYYTKAVSSPVISCVIFSLRITVFMPAYNLLLGNNQSFRNHYKSWYLQEVCKASCTLQIWTNSPHITSSPFSADVHKTFAASCLSCKSDCFPQSTTAHLCGGDFEDRLHNWQEHEVRSLCFHVQS